MADFDGDAYGNRDMAALTPSGVAMVVLLCLAAAFAVGVGLTYLEKRLGLFDKMNSNVISEGSQYRRVVRRMSRIGLELRKKSQHRELTLCSLDAESRMAPCALCGRPCSEANLGSAASAFRGAVAGSADEYMCVDCFAYIDTQEHGPTRNLLEEWRQSGGHKTSPRHRKVAQMSMSTHDTTDEVPGDEEQPLPVRAKTKRNVASVPDDDDDESKTAERSAGLWAA